MDRRKRLRASALQAHPLGGNGSPHRGCGAVAAPDDDVRQCQGSAAGRGQRMTEGRGKREEGSGKRGALAPDDGRVRIFDTTLRDGEQAPGCTMTRDEKLAVARQLARLKVDVIEAGYPAASDGDWDAVHQVAREIGNAGGPTICGLARATVRDIDRCWTAVEPAAQARIHIFLATSDVHMKHKLGMTRSPVVATAPAAVSRAARLGAGGAFSGADSARSVRTSVYEVLGDAL